MLKIAIAEDETSAQTALKEYLDRWQAENGQPVQAVFFESGSQLLENIPQGLQLALLDIQMPGLSGMETAHRLRGTLPELEIVFITSLTGLCAGKLRGRCTGLSGQTGQLSAVLPQP